MKCLTYGEILEKSSKAKEMLEYVKKQKNLFKKTKITPDLFMPKPTSKFGKLKAYLNPYSKLSKKFSKLFKENYHIIFENVICMLEEFIYILDGAFCDFKEELGTKYNEILKSNVNYKKIIEFLQDSVENCDYKPNINDALVNKIISENEKNI